MLVGQYVLYINLLLVVFFGMKSRKQNSSFFNVLLIQSVIYACVLAGLFLLKTLNESFNTSISNLIYVNIHVAIEASFLFLAASHVLKLKGEKLLLNGLVILFYSIFTFQAIQFGLEASNDSADVASCISMTILYSVIIFKFISLNKTAWWKSPEILTCIGLLLYFAGSVPFVSMSNYIAENDPDLYVTLYYIINDGLANLRYLLLAISFILIYRSAGKNQLSL